MPLYTQIEHLLDQVEALHRHHPELAAYQIGLSLAAAGLAEELDALPLEEAEQRDDAASVSGAEPSA